MDERLLTIGEVMELLQVSKRTIYKLMSEGKFPRPVKIGKSSRWRAGEIQELIEKKGVL